MTKEEKFYDTLEKIFIGAKVEGESGYINLMRIKSRYYEKGVFPKLQNDIDKALKKFPKFREELFDKLYTFFYRYFSESGSIYFRYTPIHQNIYEKVYTDDKDVILFWKTHMLYYVKTDRLFKNLETVVDGHKFFFDVSQLEHKKAFEKKSVIYDFKEKKKNGRLVFGVSYTEKGKKTKITEILKALNKEGVKITEDILEKAFRVFEKQSEVDYFINKNAKKFLKEQFNIWLYQYVFSGESEWTEERIKQLQVLKDIAFKIINFISQFEDELVKIWNKPKFVLNSNYVITLDRIVSACHSEIGSESLKFVNKILNHRNFDKQIKEWKDLGIVDKNFNPKDVIAITSSSREKQSHLPLKGTQKKESEVKGHPELVPVSHILDPKYKHLPIDTKYFKDLELEILGLFDNIDESLDGWLIKSENYQALNTILPKFKGKVQTIYIDPPFNKEQDADFHYSVKYKDTSWITLLENRLLISKDILRDTGNVFVRCDYNGNMFVRLLMNEIFGADNFRNEIAINRTKGKKKAGESLPIDKDSIFLFSNKLGAILNEVEKPLEKAETVNSVIQHLKRKKLINDKLMKELLNIIWVPLDHRPGERKTSKERMAFGRKFDPPKGRHWINSQQKLNKLAKEGKIRLRCTDCAYIHYKGKWIKCSNCKKDNPIIEVFLDAGPISESWFDIPGYSQTWKFQTENSESLLKRVIETTSSLMSDIIMDFFLGSGTTIAVAQKLGRKWFGIEMGDHFDTVIMPRMKEVLAGRGNHEPCGISKEKDVKEKYSQNNAGGFFKYYELEQYEDTLRKVKYDDSDLFDNPYENPYNQYVFMKDLKMLKALEIDSKNNKVKVDLSKLYGNIDIPETLSNLLGKRIKKIAKDEVEFEDGEKVNIKDLDYNIIKPLIWW